MAKVIILNGSPRKNFNTAKLLKEAQKGAESLGAEAEYYNLYDYNFKGCISCFACKRKGSTTNGLCAVKDDIRPILEKCINADAIIMGSPIYLSDTTGVFRAFFERLVFAAHTYLIDKENGGLKRVLDRNIPIGLIFTMNCAEQYLDKYNYNTIINSTVVEGIRHTFGYAESLLSCDTYQFVDYSKYDVDLFDENKKAKVRAEQFPIDMKKAFDLGKKLVTIKI